MERPISKRDFKAIAERTKDALVRLSDEIRSNNRPGCDDRRRELMRKKDQLEAELDAWFNRYDSSYASLPD